ncbi:acyltransferase family protein [Enterobacter asburiae]
MKRDNLASIQILRGLAALSVVLFHYRFYLVPDGADRTLPDAALGWGGVGVDLFFVISGFIMVYVTSNDDHGLASAKKFIKNRFTRVFPTYYTLLLIAFLICGALSTFHYHEKVANLFSALTLHPYKHGFGPMYIQEDGLFNIRWTLSYEIYFYCVFSLCLLSRKRYIIMTMWFSIPLVASFITTGYLTLSTKGYNFKSVEVQFLTNPIIIEFGIGILAGLCYNKLNSRYKPTPFILPLIVLFVTIYCIATHLAREGQILTAMIFLPLILTFALHNNSILNYAPKALVHLGNISFSLYLIHNPLASAISGKVEKILQNSMHNLFGFLILLLCSITAAHYSHKFIEIKLTKFIRMHIK